MSDLHLKASPGNTRAVIERAEYSSTPEDVKLIGRSGDRTGINDGPLLAVSSETAYGRTVAYPFSIKVF